MEDGGKEEVEGEEREGDQIRGGKGIDIGREKERTRGEGGGAIGKERERRKMPQLGKKTVTSSRECLALAT